MVISVSVCNNCCFLYTKGNLPDLKIFMFLFFAPQILYITLCFPLKFGGVRCVKLVWNLVLCPTCFVFFKPYQAILQFSVDTECPTNLTQFWHYQLGDSVRFYKLRVRSSQDCSHFRHQSQVQVVTSAFDWPVISQRVPQTSPWVWLICETGS